MPIDLYKHAASRVSGSGRSYSSSPYATKPVKPPLVMTAPGLAPAEHQKLWLHVSSCMVNHDKERAWDTSAAAVISHNALRMQGCPWCLHKLTHLAGWWWAHHALPLGASGWGRPHGATLLLLRHHLRGRPGGPIHGPIVVRCLLLQLGVWVKGRPLQQE